MQVILTMHLEEGDLALSQRSAVLHLLHLFGRSEEEAAAQQLQGVYDLAAKTLLFQLVEGEAGIYLQASAAGTTQASK